MAEIPANLDPSNPQSLSHPNSTQFHKYHFSLSCICHRGSYIYFYLTFIYIQPNIFIFYTCCILPLLYVYWCDGPHRLSILNQLNYKIFIHNLGALIYHKLFYNDSYVQLRMKNLLYKEQRDDQKQSENSTNSGRGKTASRRYWERWSWAE